MVILRVTFVLLGLAALGWVVYTLRTVLLMLIITTFFCYMIAPFVRISEQPIYVGGREFKLSRGVAILLVYILMAAVLLLAMQLIWPRLEVQFKELAERLPTYISSGSAAANQTITNADSWMRHLALPQQWREYLLERISEFGQIVVPWLQSLFLSLFSLIKYLPWLILVPILSFFFLKDGAAFEKALVTFLPTERLQRRIHWLLLDVSRTMAAYIRAQITACLEIAILVSIGLEVLGAPYAVVVGMAAGLLEFIPLLGPFITMCIAFGLALTVSLKLALGVLLFLGLLRIAQDYIIYPRIVGHGIKMHPLLVILAILAGAEIAGLVGVFLCIPFVGLMIVVYNHYLAYRGLENARIAVAPGEALSARESEPSPSVSSSPVVQKQS